MPLPTNRDELRKWRDFAVSRWRYERDVRLACMEAICLGMNMTPHDFNLIICAYIDWRDEQASCEPDFDLKRMMSQ